MLKILNGLAQKNWDLFIIFNFMPRMPCCQVIFVINARQAEEKDFSFRSWYFPVELSVCLSFCLFLKRNYVLISFDLSFSHDVISDCALSYTPPGYGSSWPSSSQWNYEFLLVPHVMYGKQMFSWHIYLFNETLNN